MAKKKENKISGWDFSPSPESTSHVQLKEKYDLFIDGKWVKPSSGKYFDSINPSNEKKLAQVAHANSSDVDKAVKAAKKAYEGVWGKMSGKERGKYIYRIARMMQERARELAVIETMDGGKSIRESRDIDVPLACNHFFYYAGWADKLDYAFPNRKVSSIGVDRSFRGTFLC
jgi:aldehyde dehydrogenase (NAD+)